MLQVQQDTQKSGRNFCMDQRVQTHVLADANYKSCTASNLIESSYAVVYLVSLEYFTNYSPRNTSIMKTYYKIFYRS